MAAKKRIIKKQKERMEYESPLKKFFIPLIIIGSIIIASSLVVYFVYKELWPVVSLLVLGLLVLAIAFIAKSGKRKEMSSETWMSMGILFFMMGAVVESLDVLKMLGLVYFVAGLIRKQIEDRNMSETAAKKTVFWIIFALLILFILGAIVFTIIK